MTQSKTLTELLQYNPREQQRIIHRSLARFKVIVCHRRFGKTTLAVIELTKWALKIADSKYAYIAPTYKQAKSVAWDMLKAYTRWIDWIKFNESELRADFPNGSRITLFGADNPDSLRWLALWWVVFDEYSQQPSNIYTEIIRPAISDHKGWCIWIGTPKGKNAFWELYEHSQNNEGWEWFLFKASETGIIDADELEENRKVMTQDEYNQEWECSFTAAIKWAYYSAEINEAHDKKRIRPWIYDKQLPVNTVWDLGVSDYTSIIFFQVYGWEIRIIDCHQENGKGLDHYATILGDKWYNYADHYFPHDIEVRELSTWVSRLETVRKLYGNYKCKIVPKLWVMEWISATRLLFSKFYIDSRTCDEFINTVSQYSQEWDEKRGMFKDHPRHDWTSHFADSLRYLSIAYNRIILPQDDEWPSEISYDLY